MADIRRTGYLDDFNRPDEDPLSWEGRWQYLFYNGATNLELQGGLVMLYRVSGGTSQSSYWSRAWFSGDVECWGETGGGNDLREGLRLYLHVANTYAQVGGDSMRGYRLRWTANIGANTFDIFRFDDGGAGTGLVSVEDELDTSSGMMLFRRVGDELEGWICGDYTGATWTQVISTTDSTYNDGFVGLGTQQDDNNPGWTGFGGGAIRRTQIYRYVSN